MKNSVESPEASMGDKLAGVRLTKKPGEDGKNALTEWAVTLKENPIYNPKLAIGVWKPMGETGNKVYGDRQSFFNEVKIGDDGTCWHVDPQKGRYRGKYEVMDDGKVLVKHAGYEALVYWDPLQRKLIVEENNGSGKRVVEYEKAY